MHSSIGSCLQWLSCMASNRMPCCSLSRNNVVIIHPRCESQSATRETSSLSLSLSPLLFEIVRCSANKISWTNLFLERRNEIYFYAPSLCKVQSFKIQYSLCSYNRFTMKYFLIVYFM